MLFSASRVVGGNAKWMHQNKVANHLLYSNSQTNGVHGYLGMNTYYRHQVSSFTSLEVIAGWNFIHPGNLVHFPTLRPGLRLCLSEGQLCSTSPGLTSAFLLWMPWAEVDSDQAYFEGRNFLFRTSHYLENNRKIRPLSFASLSFTPTSPRATTSYSAARPHRSTEHFFSTATNYFHSPESLLPRWFPGPCIFSFLAGSSSWKTAA